VSGGWFGVLMRCGLYIGMYWLAYWAMFPWNAPVDSRTINWRDVTEGYQFFVVPLFVVDSALCLSRLFHEEIRQNTLPSLLMLPHSVPYIAYNKVCGCLLGLVPGMIAVVTAFTLFSDSTRTLDNIVREPATWWVLANLCLIVHLSAMFSTYLRWGAFALSLIVTGGFMLLTDFFLGQLARATSMNHSQLITVMIMMIIPVVLACAGCHLVVLLRLPALAEK
jgi:ABC-type Na+ efflux pump permease subunit